MRRIVVGCVMTMMLACGGKDGPTAPRAVVTGVWRGTMAGQGLVELVLTDTRGRVTGTASIRDGAALAPFTVKAGTFAPPQLTLTLDFLTAATVTVTATVTGDAMVAHFNGSGFNRDTVTLKR